MAQSKFFFVRSYLNGLVLEVQNSNAFEGAAIAMWHQKPDGNDNQLFYDDPTSGTIRTKLNDFAVDLQGDSLVIAPWHPENPTQQWMLAGNRIQSRHNPSNVWDISEENQDAGAPVGAADFNGSPNQSWSIEYTSPRLFFLRSEMHGKVVDIRGGDPSPGTKIIMYEQQDGIQENQLWYEDRYGVIRSKLNDFAIDSSEGSMRMAPYDPSIPTMQWVLSGNRITNRSDPNMVMDIKGASSSNGAKLIQYDYNGDDNQHWILNYVE